MLHRKTSTNSGQPLLVTGATSADVMFFNVYINKHLQGMKLRPQSINYNERKLCIKWLSTVVTFHD